MELVGSKHIDKQQWDEWVKQSGGTVFSRSAYLDATADDWAVVYNDQRTGGIACPFTLKLGVLTLYAPFFHRYIEWIGTDRPSEPVLIEVLKKYFPVADAQLHWPGSEEKRKHQEITREQFQPNQQAKRMLKKAARYEVETSWNPKPLLELLRNELAPRVAAVNDHSLSLLEKLVHAFQEPEIRQLNLLENGQWQGGIWLLCFGDRVLYLKGTVTSEVKENGGMYRLMEEAMQFAFVQQAVFDFGGSNVEGVRRFNLHWGSSDVFYSHLSWNNAPLWWKSIKSLRSKWKKRSY